MSEPRFVMPELRLTRLIAEPGGLTADDALRRASENLRSIAPTCRAEMLALLERAEGLAGQMGETPDAAAVTALYGLAVSAIGGGEVSGAPGVDEALKSLSDLIDALRARATFDRAAVGVCLKSWRLLMTAGPDEAARGAILGGLRAVAARYDRTD